jgi:hypothetical protein
MVGVVHIISIITKKNKGQAMENSEAKCLCKKQPKGKNDYTVNQQHHECLHENVEHQNTSLVNS